jgi:dihydroflavonol-4-reductase
MTGTKKGTEKKNTVSKKSHLNRIFVTGASGFLGQHLLQTLKHRGFEYTALSRSSDEEGFVQGDILEREGLESLMEGHDILIHAAGLVSHDPKDSDLLWKLHVNGTKNVCEAARKVGISRVIYLSTSGTVAVSKENREITEDGDSPLPLIKEWPYYRSKLFAEDVALSFQDGEMDVVSLNPSLLLGPGDRYDGESTKSIRLLLDKQMPIAPSGGLAFVDVRDVVEAIILSLKNGRGGQRYLLNGTNVSFGEYYKRLARLADVSAPLMTMPKQTKGFLSLFPKWKDVGGALGLDISRHDLLLASHYWYCDCSKARSELLWVPRDPLTTLSDTVHDIQKKRDQYNPWE